MNFEEARKALLNGEKVRRISWVCTEYVYLNDSLIIKNQDNEQVYIHYSEYRDNNWELYKETAKPAQPFKVQILEWFKPEDKMPDKNRLVIAKDKDGDYRTSLCQFGLSKESFKYSFNCWAYLEDLE